jgi:hypothetical protein
MMATAERTAPLRHFGSSALDVALCGLELVTTAQHYDTTSNERYVTCPACRRVLALLATPSDSGAPVMPTKGGK